MSAEQLHQTYSPDRISEGFELSVDIPARTWRIGIQRKLESINSLPQRIEYLLDLTERMKFSPGIAVEVFDVDSTLCSTHRGVSDHRNIPINPQSTVFDITSISKLVTTSTLHWSLEQHVQDIVPLHETLGNIYTPWKESALGAISVRDLITHNSRLACTQRFGIDTFSGFDSLVDAFANPQVWKLTNKPYDYRCHNTMLLVIAYYLKTGSRFRDIIEQCVTTNNLGFILNPSKLDPESTAHSLHPISKTPVIGNHDWKGHFDMVGPSGVFGTRDQLTAFMQKLMSGQIYDHSRHLSDFGVSNSRSSAPDLPEDHTYDDARFNSMSLKQMDIISDPWLYIHGFTGPFVAWNTNTNTGISLVANPRINQGHISDKRHQQNMRLRVPLYSLFCSAVDGVK
jgi:hypothetical protein